ncbi:hypothetical protein HK098_004017 [Nowakowskiella sp. JEL0407]|nr:hypothetical protein HK098_004017 [Nowakowskiella sp. JEL0407]
MVGETILFPTLNSTLNSKSDSEYSSLSHLNCNEATSVHVPVIAIDELRVRAPFDATQHRKRTEINDQSNSISDEDTASSFDSDSSSSLNNCEEHVSNLSIASEEAPTLLNDSEVLAKIETYNSNEISIEVEESTSSNQRIRSDSLDIREWWLEGRPREYYPDDNRLPWHFSFIDDGSVGGMSAPVERKNWKAFVEAKVGLVVNATEAPIYGGSSSSNVCHSCGFMEEFSDEDVFDDLEESDGVKVLFLPVPDGSVPRYSQIRAFLKHAFHTVDVLKKKVMIHCQAGIGRTGTLLAIYLMERYNITAAEAILRLRKLRPQSLQFHRSDWQNFPFRRDPNAEIYSRNLLQECFIQRYYDLIIKGRENGKVSSFEMSDVEHPIFPLPLGSLCTDSENLARLVELLEEHLAKALPKEDIENADIQDGFQIPNLSTQQKPSEYKCYVCQRISVVGPYTAAKSS